MFGRSQGSGFGSQSTAGGTNPFAQSSGVGTGGFSGASGVGSISGGGGFATFGQSSGFEGAAPRSNGFGGSTSTNPFGANASSSSNSTTFGRSSGFGQQNSTTSPVQAIGGSSSSTSFGKSSSMGFEQSAPPPAPSFGNSSAVSGFGSGTMSSSALTSSFGQASGFGQTSGFGQQSSANVGSRSNPFGAGIATTSNPFGGSSGSEFGSQSTSGSKSFGGNGGFRASTTADKTAAGNGFSSGSISSTGGFGSSSLPSSGFASQGASSVAANPFSVPASGGAITPKTTFGQSPGPSGKKKLVFGSGSSGRPLTGGKEKKKIKPATTFGTASTSSTPFGKKDNSSTTFNEEDPRAFGGSKNKKFGKEKSGSSKKFGSSDDRLPIRVKMTSFGNNSSIQPPLSGQQQQTPSIPQMSPLSTPTNGMSSAEESELEKTPPRFKQTKARKMILTRSPMNSDDENTSTSGGFGFGFGTGMGMGIGMGTGHDDLYNNTKAELASAMNLDGTCIDMCSPKERELHIRVDELSLFEKCFPNEPGKEKELIIKRFQRSSADHKLDIPSEIRPPGVLRTTLLYIEKEIMDREKFGPDPRFDPPRVPELIELYNFCWDRTRMLRKDFILQNFRGAGGRVHPIVLDVHERIARYHILSEHELCEEKHFVAQQNMEQLGQTLKTLNELYDESHKRCDPAYLSPFESEFRGYFILCTLDNERGLDVLKFVKGLQKQILLSTQVQFAMQIFIARHTNDYFTFFKLLRQATYLQACLVFRYLPSVRSCALERMNRAYRKQKFALKEIVSLLCFDDQEHAKEVLTAHGIFIQHKKQTSHIKNRKITSPQITTSTSTTTTTTTTTSSSSHSSCMMEFVAIFGGEFETDIELRKEKRPLRVRKSKIYVSEKKMNCFRRDICRGVTEYTKENYPPLSEMIESLEQEERNRLYPSRPPYEDAFTYFEKYTKPSTSNATASIPFSFCKTFSTTTLMNVPSSVPLAHEPKMPFAHENIVVKEEKEEQQQHEEKKKEEEEKAVAATAAAAVAAAAAAARIEKERKEKELELIAKRKADILLKQKEALKRIEALEKQKQMRLIKDKQAQEAQIQEQVEAQAQAKAIQIAKAQEDARTKALLIERQRQLKEKEEEAKEKEKEKAKALAIEQQKLEAQRKKQQQQQEEEEARRIAAEAKRIEAQHIAAAAVEAKAKAKAKEEAKRIEAIAFAEKKRQRREKKQRLAILQLNLYRWKKYTKACTISFEEKPPVVFDSQWLVEQLKSPSRPSLKETIQWLKQEPHSSNTRHLCHSSFSLLPSLPSPPPLLACRRLLSPRPLCLPTTTPPCIFPSISWTPLDLLTLVGDFFLSHQPTGIPQVGWKLMVIDLIEPLTTFGQWIATKLGIQVLQQQQQQQQEEETIEEEQKTAKYFHIFQGLHPNTKQQISFCCCYLDSRFTTNLSKESQKKVLFGISCILIPIIIDGKIDENKSNQISLFKKKFLQFIIQNLSSNTLFNLFVIAFVPEEKQQKQQKQKIIFIEEELFLWKQCIQQIQKKSQGKIVQIGCELLFEKQLKRVSSSSSSSSSSLLLFRQEEKKKEKDYGDLFLIEIIKKLMIHSRVCPDIVAINVQDLLQDTLTLALKSMTTNLLQKLQIKPKQIQKNLCQAFFLCQKAILQHSYMKYDYPPIELQKYLTNTFVGWNSERNLQPIRSLLIHLVSIVYNDIEEKEEKEEKEKLQQEKKLLDCFIDRLYAYKNIEKIKNIHQKEIFMIKQMVFQELYAIDEDDGNNDTNSSIQKKWKKIFRMIYEHFFEQFFFCTNYTNYTNYTNFTNYTNQHHHKNNFSWIVCVERKWLIQWRKQMHHTLQQDEEIKVKDIHTGISFLQKDNRKSAKFGQVQVFAAENALERSFGLTTSIKTSSHHRPRTEELLYHQLKKRLRLEMTQSHQDSLHYRRFLQQELR